MTSSGGMSAPMEKTQQVDTQSADQARPRGLSVVTNLPIQATDEERYNQVLQRMKNNTTSKVATGNTISTRRISVSGQNTPSSQVEGSSKREFSKALLNDDWRHKWRPDGNREHLNSENHKETSKVAKRNLRLDTAAASMAAGPVRRYRGTNDSPLDRDFITSAPATKLEYCFVGEKRNDNAESAAGSDQLSLGPQQLMNLKLWTPIVYSGDQYRLASVTKDPGSQTNELLAGNHLPLVQVQGVNNGTGLQPQQWEALDKTVLEQLAQSGIPQSADKTEQKNSTKAESTKKDFDVREFQEIGTNGLLSSKDPSPSSHGQKSEGNRWDALLAKINKKSTNLPKVSNTTSEGPPLADVQTISGSDGSGRGVTNSSTLNPKASEFFQSAEVNLQPSTYHFERGHNFSRPSVIGLFNNETVPAPAQQNDEAALRSLISGIEAHLVESNRQQHATHEFLMNYLNQLHQRLPPAAPESGHQLQQDGLSGGLAAGNDTVQLPGPGISAGHVPPGAVSFPVPFHYQNVALGTYDIPPPPGFPAPAGIPSVSVPVNYQKEALNNSIVPPPELPAPPGVASVSAPVHYQHAALDTSAAPATPAVPTVPPPGLFEPMHHASTGPVGQPTDGSFMANATTALIPHPKQYAGPTAHAPGGQCPPAGQIHGPVVFPHGPKPVMKPRGTPATNSAWSKQQQEYEAYLEWRRTNDPTYHQECRNRQSKRAYYQKRAFRSFTST